MRLSAIMPGYLLDAKLFPGPMLIYPRGFILNYTQNEHELDPNLCVVFFYRILHYDISKPVCGHLLCELIFCALIPKGVFLEKKTLKIGISGLTWLAFVFRKFILNREYLGWNYLKSCKNGLMIRKFSLANGIFSTKIYFAKGIWLKTGAAHPRQIFYVIITQKRGCGV